MKNRKDSTQFVITKNNKTYPAIEQNDVGITKSVKDSTASVFFIRVWKKIDINLDDVEFFNIDKTGDLFDKKICNICHKLLPTNYFARNQNQKGNRIIRRSSCKNCRKMIEGVHIETTSQKQFSKTKPHKEPFECPICLKRTIAGITSKVVMDHNHKTGKIRGWICDSCNTGIGRFKDDITILKRAIKFLK